VHVVATAGHVDHGKSTLVEALTGMQPDRLDEERRRGLSIQLGYCWTALPDVGDVAFVDVPGHERFISTTLSGVGPVPVVMFVVAADDPWMPQAAEHLAACDALGVSHGLLVVTRSDLTDPAPALSRARAELARTTLRDVPSVTVSGRTGEGLDDLRRTLTGVLARTPAPDPDADVRLWVDRRFHVKGTGTVVTGTLPAGTIRVGDVLEVAGEPVRVRGLETLERGVDSVPGVARVALAVGGRVPARLSHGAALVSRGAFLDTEVVDVRLRGDGAPPERPLLHIGSAAVAVHARPLADGLARLTLEASLALRVGDRAILRDPGSRQLWGVVVLDPLPPRLARRGAVKERATELENVDGTLASEVRRRGVVRRSELRRLGGDAGDPEAGGISIGDWLVSPARAASLRADLADVVAKASTPFDHGLTIEAAARALDLPDPAIVSALVSPPLHVEDGRVLPKKEGLPAHLESSLAALHADLGANPFAAPDAARLAELGLDPAALATLARDGHVLRIAEVVLLPGADEQAVALLGRLSQPFTTSQARQALGTTRRVALPLLAHLDRTGRTVRLPDDRRRVRTSDR
jgi:selenocysteine-specific elongation factor